MVHSPGCGSRRYSLIVRRPSTIVLGLLGLLGLLGRPARPTTKSTNTANTKSRQRMHAAIAIVIIMLWLHLTTLTSEFDRLNALAPHDRFMHLVKQADCLGWDQLGSMNPSSLALVVGSERWQE